MFRPNEKITREVHNLILLLLTTTKSVHSRTDFETYFGFVNHTHSGILAKTHMHMLPSLHW